MTGGVIDGIAGAQVIRPFIVAVDEPAPTEVYDDGVQANVSDVHDAGFTRFSSQAEFEGFLLRSAVDQWKYIFGRPAWGWHGSDDVVVLDSTGIPSDQMNRFTAAEAASHSDTNVQVDGVDEGDMVETDGGFLYLITENQLVIVDAREPDDLDVVSRTKLSGSPAHLYLHGDRVTVVSHGLSENPLRIAAGWWTPSVDVTVLDVRDRANPTTVEITRVDGQLLDSRAVGSHVFLVVSNSMNLPVPDVVPIGGVGVLPGEWPDEASQETGRYETEDEYVARIRGTLSDRVLPRYEGRHGDGESRSEGFVSEATDVFHPIGPHFGNLVSVLSVNVADDSPGLSSSLSIAADWAAAVYMTDHSLYLFTPRHGQGFWEGFSESSTGILRFNIESTTGQIEQVAHGEVRGTIINRFSVSEHEGHLYIATTNGWGESSRNHVYVLAQSGEGFAQVGQLEDLAPGEQIYSVRFMGDRGYVVTFERVDPLFAIDLSDPTNPRVLGQLKIPGFSEYLQPVGQDHLLGLGRNADAETGITQELQLSLFDVSEMTNPILVDRYSFEGGQSGYSAASYDPHAFSYFASHNVLAIPVSTHRWGGELVDPYTDATSYGLQLFTIDAIEGIEWVGQIEHESEVRRSVRLDDFVLSISTDSVKVNEIAAPERERDELEYRLGPGDDYFILAIDSQNNELDVLINDPGIWTMPYPVEQIWMVTDVRLDTTLVGGAERIWADSFAPVPKHDPTSWTITGVGTTSDGGAVTIADGGDRLIYTPAAGFAGHEQFAYTATSDDGLEVRYTVEVRVGDPASAKSGNQADMIHAGPIIRYLGDVVDTKTGEELPGDDSGKDPLPTSDGARDEQFLAKIRGDIEAAKAESGELKRPAASSAATRMLIVNTLQRLPLISSTLAEQARDEFFAALEQLAVPAGS